MTTRAKPLISYILTLSMLLSLFFSQGPVGLLPVHAQDAASSTSRLAPLIPHPFPFHKPVCPPAVGPGFARCNAVVVTDAAGALMASDSLLAGSYGPADFRGVYGLSGTTATNRTVAIVDAYDDPTALADLDTYSTTYGIPLLNHCAVSAGTAAHPCIQKVDQSGGTSNSNWTLETALDLEAVHALCQNCNILLVEAADSSDGSLISTADQTAYTMGANVVSNSWGGSEWSGETSWDTYFSHPGVAYVFSSGDSGFGVQYPAASPNVTAVGGTTLQIGSNHSYSSETAWSGAGSGCSAYESKPGFQHDAGCTQRTVADVSADADPNTGAAVYLSGTWYQVGGTSLAAPLVAAVFGMAGGVGSTLGNSLPYANLNYGVNLRDVTSGSNGTCGGSYLCIAKTGYDGPTGLGTPLGSSAFTTVPNHTVTFNNNGGSGTMSPQIANVPTALTPNTFTRTGYSFSGWNTQSGGGGTSYADGAIYSFSADITLYAQWTALPNHTVTFNSNGGSGTMSPQIANVPTALTLNTFTRAGYSFSGWNTQSGGGGTPYADGAVYSFSADITLYAQWTALSSHTVTFNNNGGSGTMSPQIANIPTALTLNTFTRAGYSFSGWNTIPGGGGTPYADGAVYSFSADITLYAQWTALPSHTVTFNSNGGSGTMSPQIANVPTALTLNTFTRTGYSFSGWNTQSGGGGTSYADGAIYSFSADITLYAQWTSLPNHTVTFNNNGGSGTMSPQIANVPTALTLNTFTRAGYSFSGWNTLPGGGGTAYADGAVYAFSADITLYAQWTALPNYTVTFNNNGGSGTMSPQIANVPTALTPNTFTRTGYSFSGWNTLPGGGGTPYADGAVYSFSADITLYAQWTALPNYITVFLPIIQR